MIRLLPLVVFGIILLGALVSLWSGGPAGGDLVAPPREWGRGYDDGRCFGTLAALTPTSLTLTDPVEFGSPNGSAPERFALGPALAAGTYLLDPNGGFDLTNCSQNPTHTYRVRDLRLGDKIEIYYVKIKGVNVCDEICIRRRPGGQVPPLPGQPRRYNRNEYHNVMSYLGWLEERGLPRPDPFVPPELPPEERDPKENPPAQ